MISEAFLSFVWKYALFQNTENYWEGESMEVVYPGESNPHAGPDFINARIKFGDTIWVGNVEIHIKSSDWELHRHDSNAAYDNVILQVVFENDKEVFNSKGRKIPSWALHFNGELFEKYSGLCLKESWIACEDQIKNVPYLAKLSCLESMAIEKLSSKTDAISSDLANSAYDWEEIFFRQLARSFGFHLNAPPFELLTTRLPFSIILKYTSDILQLESLLFGMSGFLSDDHSSDPYYNTLKKEFEFLKNKYSLNPVEIHLWKFLRLRPGNFPTIRLSQFASLLNKFPRLFSLILEANTIKELELLFNISASEYWNEHYTFLHKSKYQVKRLGKASSGIIIMNTIIPFLFIYGVKTGKSSFQEKAVHFLESLPPEDNSITRKWKDIGIKATNAFDSQALLFLKEYYCDKKRCIECKIGIELITH